MKNMRINTGIIALSFMAVSIVSCKDENKTEKTAANPSEINNDSNNQDVQVEAILKGYFNLKDALVKDDNEKTNAMGETLVQSLEDFDGSAYDDAKKSELMVLIKTATEHAKEIPNGTIQKQRRYFKSLTEEVTKIIAITGSANKIYEQFCPMYSGGSAWLSLSDEIRNPYYGSTMLQCGTVKREI